MPTTATQLAPTDSASSHPHARLAEAIHQAAHYLPAQGPITAFVHHNTLHAFEHLSFEEAVVAGGAMFGCHPYLQEDAYRSHLAKGRITHDDLEAVLIEDLGDRGDHLLGFLGTRFALRLRMLAHPLRTGPTAELLWLIKETEALTRFRHETPAEIRDGSIAATRHWVMRDLAMPYALAASDRRARHHLERISRRHPHAAPESWDDATWEATTLQMLWAICREGVAQTEVPVDETSQLLPRRHRDLIYDRTGVDCDELVHGVLIRFCAAFVDQGFALWPLPKGLGFFESFSQLFRQPFGSPEPWRRALAAELHRIDQRGYSPLDVIAESLDLLRVPEPEVESYLRQSLLALRGYAGMLWQIENRGDRVAHGIPPGTLIEFVAVRLLLDRLAIQHVARESLSYRGSLDRLGDWLSSAPHDDVASVERRAYLVFQLAQLEGWTPQTMYRLSSAEWQHVMREIESFSRLERRRTFHLAYERRYRLQTLDAISAHWTHLQSQTPPTGPERSRPRFQIVSCIDEREESFRRHLEEVAPDCETFSAAGFFSVAMYYRGAADAHFTPLCPVVIKPRHYVTESVVEALVDTDRRRRQRRKAIGSVTRRVHVGSRTFAGGWIAGVLGSLATAPLVMRILFPRATAQLRGWMGSIVKTPPLTELRLERSAEEPGPEGDHIGYRIDEMAVIVERTLRDIGLTSGISRIFVVCGHGSSSLNNPHESAHDCGACAGGRGGPNARAFSQMANDPEVRALVTASGITIPDDTWFVGAYHNTCDDSVTYYDVAQIPASHQGDFAAARVAIDEARKRSAHERCRRFETAHLDWTPERALQHVEGRSEDLSQVRPEYGHATNAICLVGRREWSRNLFLDRRAFLQSYDPASDDGEHSILNRILQAVIPVCAGINLEYYFSYVDPTGYGCGTKLPHNITALVGVMNGAASDLRTGLPWQMVETHEPVRLLFVIETTPATMFSIMKANPGIDRLVRGGWVQLATFDPERNRIELFRHGNFATYRPQTWQLPAAESSLAWYRGWRDALGFASIVPSRLGRITT